MLHYPLSPQHTPTQARIHLPVPGGSQPRSPTGSPLTCRREMVHSNLTYQEFHSIQFFPSTQSSPAHQLEQLPGQPSLYRHELPLSPLQSLEHFPCPYQTTGVNPALYLSGPIQQLSRLPAATFNEHAILHSNLHHHQHEFTHPPKLNLNLRDGMPIPEAFDLETVTQDPCRIGMAGFIADPSSSLIVTKGDHTMISPSNLPRLASLDDITSAREMEGIGSMDTDSMDINVDLDSMYSDRMYSDPMYTIHSMNSDFLNSESLYPDTMDTMNSMEF